MTANVRDRALVLISHESADGHLCVDLIRRANGTFGFEEYRRDPDDGRGWYPVGGTGDVVFKSRDEALDAARRSVGWLDEVLGDSD